MKPVSPRRSRSAGSLRRSLSKPPSLSTVWEWDGHDIVDAVPSTDDVMSPLQPAQSEPMRGPLALRSAPSWFRYFGRRVWTSRYAVLQPATASSPPRLLLFLSESMDELHEELLLLSPVQLDCLANDGTTGHGQHANFTLSSAGAAPIELSAPSDDERQQWIFHLGERCEPRPRETRTRGRRQQPRAERVPHSGLISRAPALSFAACCPRRRAARARRRCWARRRPRYCRRRV